MLVSRRLIHLAYSFPRFFAKKVKQMNPNLKQVHQETMRYISPSARINIQSDIGIRVRSGNVFNYPGGNIFIAELHGSRVKNCTATMNVRVSENEEQVDVELRKLSDHTDFHCELEVPIKASLYIDTKGSASVVNVLGQELIINAQKNINIQEVRGERISISSQAGNVTCTGLLLGKTTTIETNEKGSIFLDKLQGDKLKCKTVEGNIGTKSCYVERSKFETDSGCLDLKNVHKSAEVHIHKKGDLKMTGVHGNIQVSSNGGNINLQLSELIGDSKIDANNVDETSINISHNIEKNSIIEIFSSFIKIEDSINHLADCVAEDKQSFYWNTNSNTINKIIVRTTGGVKVGRLSWAECVLAKT